MDIQIQSVKGVEFRVFRLLIHLRLVNILPISYLIDITSLPLKFCNHLEFYDT